jgi:hypothetical protein
MQYVWVEGHVYGRQDGRHSECLRFLSMATSDGKQEQVRAMILKGRRVTIRDIA